MSRAIEKKVVLHIGPDIHAKGGIASVLAGYKRAASLFEENGYDLWFLPTSSKSGEAALWRFVRTWWTMILLCVTGRVAIVHIHASVRGSLIRKLVIAYSCIGLRRKYVMHVHSGLFSDYCDRLPEVIKKIVRTAFKRADQVICLSGYARRDFVAAGLAYDSTCAVIYNGSFEPKEIENGAGTIKPDSRVRMLFMGKLAEAKGVFLLLDAIKEIKIARADFELVVAGSGDLEKFSDRVRMNRLDDCVNFVGWVDGRQKDILLRSADMFVLPSRSEGFSVAIVEAMAYGIPVVSTTIPGVMDAIQSGEQGLLVQCDDKIALRDALEKLIRSRCLREKFGKKAREKFIENFSMKIAVDRLCGVYGCILS